jgi:hypothetical protein
MKQIEFSRMNASFLHRRYAIQLGRRYAIAAASFIFLGLAGYSKITNSDSFSTQSLSKQQSFTFKQISDPNNSK